MRSSNGRPVLKFCPSLLLKHVLLGSIWKLVFQTFKESGPDMFPQTDSLKIFIELYSVFLFMNKCYGWLFVYCELYI